VNLYPTFTNNYFFIYALFVGEISYHQANKFNDGEAFAKDHNEACDSSLAQVLMFFLDTSGFISVSSDPS